MPALEVDKEIKEWKDLKILNPNKLFTGNLNAELVVILKSLANFWRLLK